MKKILIYILALFSFSAIYSHTVVFDNYKGIRSDITCGKILVDMWGADSVVRYLVDHKSISLTLYCDSIGNVDSVIDVRLHRAYDANAKEKFINYFAKHKVRCEYYSDAYYDWNKRNNHNQYIADLDRFISGEQAKSDSVFKETGYQVKLCFPGNLSVRDKAEDDGLEDLTELERVLMRLDIPLDSVNFEGINVDSVRYLF